MEQTEQRIARSPGFKTGLKLAVLLGLLLVFIVPLSMIGSLVDEREQRQRATQEELISLQGGRQVVTGPLMLVPVTVTVVSDQGILREQIREVAILPESLATRVRLTPEILTRGIYEVPVYQASVEMDIEFSLPQESALPVDRLVRVHWGEARVAIGIQGVSGLRTQPVVAVDGRAAAVASGNRQIGSARSGIAMAVSQAAPGSAHTATVALALGGGGSIHFVPTAVRSSLTMTSPWPSPSFSGEMLPSSRSLTDDGFESHWETTSLGMGMPEAWLATDSSGSGEHWLHANRIGVELFRPVGHYQRTTRSVKYGILFVLLPMVALFLLEVFTSVRIHPIQYLMVAAAKTVFYLLLLSLSEQIGFTTAYWSAAAVTIILVTGYLSGLVARRGQALLVGGMVATEYLFLFTALQSEDYALLIGSLGLFVLLAVVMIATRKINWYAPGRS